MKTVNEKTVGKAQAITEKFLRQHGESNGGRSESENTLGQSARCWGSSRRAEHTP
jgi:hypothetical protein